MGVEFLHPAHSRRDEGIETPQKRGGESPPAFPTRYFLLSQLELSFGWLGELIQIRPLDAEGHYPAWESPKAKQSPQIPRDFNPPLTAEGQDQTYLHSH